MNLIINQYDNTKETLQELKNLKKNSLADIVFAVELGFTNKINNRTFLHSHMFCFHYCIDFYEGEKNVSFNILNSNDQTGEYCFWKYTCNFYKEDEKSKKIQIENIQLNIPKIKEPLDIKENELFHIVIEKIKTTLWNKHKNILNDFKREGIHYSKSEMNDFSKKLKKFIDICYKEIDESELKTFIKEYQVNALNVNLMQKNKVEKKLKI